MRGVAVQTGLSPLSVLGGTVTDREFLTRLADRGVEIHVLAEEGEPIVEHPGLVPHYWRRRLRKKLPYIGNMDVALDLRALLKSLPPVDWVRFNSPYAVGLGTLAGASGRPVWASYLHLEDDRPFRRAVDRWLPGRCELVTCLSEDTREDLVRRCPTADKGSTIVVPMGIDLERIRSAGRPREAVRAELGVGPDETLVLYVGVLSPRKGIADLVAAWKALGSRADARLLLVARPLGDAPDEARLVEELVRTDPRVRHLPGVPYERVPEIFRASDVFFFPTHLEGFGIVVGEAMAAGLPVVTTRARGVRTVVDEGVTSLSADVGDAASLSAHVATLLDDAGLRARMGAAGRERIRTEFDWDRTMTRLHRALESLGETPRTAPVPRAGHVPTGPGR